MKRRRHEVRVEQRLRRGEGAQVIAHLELLEDS